tara:strand:- start:7157 stop:7444 length:288 start_codon:yes stop_codon:yes gene_type:complete
MVCTMGLMPKNLTDVMRDVNRFEVIDDTGRAYTKYLKEGERVRYMLQDDNRTLKVFIDHLDIKEGNVLKWIDRGDDTYDLTKIKYDSDSGLTESF